LNPYAEGWVRSVKEEAPSRLILFGEASLHHALHEYVDYAGVALRHRLTVVTSNTGHFERIPELPLENWLELPQASSYQTFSLSASLPLLKSQFRIL
jgi:hypothetical protein